MEKERKHFMNLHFVLRNTYESKNGLRQIQLVYCANNRQIKLDTKVRVRTKDWHDGKQQILSSVSEISEISEVTKVNKTSKELNNELTEKKKKVLTIVENFKEEHKNGTSVVPDPDITYVKERFNEVLKKFREEKPLLEHLQDYINERKSNLDTVYDGLNMDKRSGAYKTLSHFEVLLNDLRKFSEETKKTYYFRDIDKKFKDSLIKFYLS
jgi:hypothetical protein